MPAPGGPRPVVSFVAVAALSALALWRSSPPSPRGPDAPPADFSAARARGVLDRLLADGAPRPVGSAAHAAFLDRLRGELAAVGLEAEVEEGFACSPRGSCANVTNLVAVLPGSGDGPAVLVSAHTDSVAAGPGAADDASGVAALLECARALLAAPRRNPVILLFDDGEEAGLLGAELFQRSARSSLVGAVVNVEARGTGGASLMFETSRENGGLVREAVARMPRPVTSSIFSFVYDRLPNDTNLTVWKRDGVPGLNLAFVDGAARYHTREDSARNLSAATLQHHGENALALVRALADADLSAARLRSAGRSVFFDVLGRFVVSWPVGWTPFLALGGLALVRLAVRARGGRFLPAGRAVVPPLAPVASALAGALAWQLLKRAGALPVDFVASPWAGALAASLAALAASAALLPLEQRGLGSGERGWERCWTSFALLGLVLSFVAPETAYAPVVAALVAGGAGLALRGRRAPFAPWPGAVALGALLLPIALRLPEALGAPALPAVAAALGAVFASLALAGPGPLPEAGRRGEALPLAGGALAAAGLFFAVAVALPATTVDSPEAGSLVLLQEAGQPASRLVYSPASGRLAPGVAAAGAFGELESPFPWARRARGFAAPHPRFDAAPPGIALGETAPIPGGRRRVAFRVTSPRGAGSLGIHLPDGAGVSGIRVNGIPLAKGYLRNPPAAAAGAPVSLFAQAVPASGLLVEMELPAAPREILVVDQVSGLPASARKVSASRPAAVSPSGSGDRTIVYSRTTL